MEIKITVGCRSLIAWDWQWANGETGSNAHNRKSRSCSLVRMFFVMFFSIVEIDKLRSSPLKSEKLMGLNEICKKRMRNRPNSEALLDYPSSSVRKGARQKLVYTHLVTRLRD